MFCDKKTNAIKGLSLVGTTVFLLIGSVATMGQEAHDAQKLTVEQEVLVTTKLAQPQQPHQKEQKRAQSNPNIVKLFKHGLPKWRYEKIGTVEVYTFNEVGLSKYQDDIEQTMREQAAKMGGNAIINIKAPLGLEIGTVIVYKNLHKRMKTS